MSISKAEPRVPGAERWCIPILPYGQLRFSHTVGATPRITPRSLPPRPSPGLWGCSWLPHGSLSRGPGLTGVTADRGVLFLGRLLLAGAAPPRGRGQHTASEGRAAQGSTSGPHVAQGLSLSPPRPSPAPRGPHAGQRLGTALPFPASPSRRPTSQSFAAIPAPSVFPGHEERAPAGISRAPPGGGGGGVRVPARPHQRADATAGP